MGAVDGIVLFVIMVVHTQSVKPRAAGEIDQTIRTYLVHSLICWDVQIPTAHGIDRLLQPSRIEAGMPFRDRRQVYSVV